MVNRDKGECISVSASSNFRHKPFGLKWTWGANYLGVYITNDINARNDIHFGNKIKNIEDILKLWSIRKLTLEGKIQVVNTLIISQVLPITI